MRSPSPDEIRAERNRAGWSKETAAASVCVSLRSWQAYEAGERRMPAATWTLFTLLLGRRTMTREIPGGREVLRLIVEKSDRPATP